MGEDLSSFHRAEPEVAPVAVQLPPAGLQFRRSELSNLLGHEWVGMHGDERVLGGRAEQPYDLSHGRVSDPKASPAGMDLHSLDADPCRKGHLFAEPFDDQLVLEP